MKNNTLKPVKLLLFAWICFFSTKQGVAQKIHSIIFANTFDRAIGGSCQQDLNTMRAFVSDIANALGTYTIDEHLYSNDKFTLSNFTSCSLDFKSQPNDLIILYISSHGDRDKKSKTEFPNIIFDSSDAAAYDIFLKLTTLPHKTCMGIIDACNLFNISSPAEMKAFPKGKLSGTLNTNQSFVKKNVSSVFLDNSFNLLITGSQPGAACISNPDGSLFTGQLVKQFDYYLSLNNPKLVSIDNILDKIKYETLTESSRQVYNDKLNLADPENSPYFPMWRVCDGQFPCDDPLYYKQPLTNSGILSEIAPSNMELNELLNLQQNAFKSSIGSGAYSITTQIQDVDLQQAKLHLSDKLNKYYMSAVRFFSYSGLDSLQVPGYDRVRDVNPNQFLIHSQVIPLNQLLKKQFKATGKYLTTVKILAPPSLLKNVRYVSYYLQPQSKKPVRTVTDNVFNYQITTFLNENFFLIARVTFKDYTYVNISKEIIVKNK